VETRLGLARQRARFAFNALQSSDLHLLLAIFFMSACLIVIINLAAKMIYVMLGPGAWRFDMWEASRG